ncbi:short chain dehydrogenase/reductase [Blastomyces gilchristii SLH14081]|uniref:Short chain dehydrogenase/reductase n=1 Tax=Blastomyces gilchristii (strain SLH14081) TaxID=559298 RepID=A0A179UR47_BLAGS|nr:short chain dehydrogenase/reductase [Blastomyces gilchristii SLH14081]EQL29380.1 hypothetical protein BDFG_08007 [Blastomyces dermatitidis ATCC 26199]OAT08892.1 short chain dehydrogenase/reductase [Blastomyces gilchristii SLH14081]
MDFTMTVLSVFTAFGALAILYVFIKVCHVLYIFCHPSTLPKYLDKTKGSYALVTGSTEGIGTAFARELCKYGFNIVLHGRNPEKLSRIENNLKHEFPHTKFRQFIFDASQPTESLEKVVDRMFNDIPLTVLVNNVGGTAGQTRSQFMTLKDHTNEEVDRVINVNMRFMTQLTRVLLPHLERNSPALIINISSVSSIGMPYLTIYAATKAYIQSFTNGLNMEMKAEGKHIDVMSMVVASTQTAGNPRRLSFFVPTADKIARSSLARVGCGGVSVTPYWRHWLQKLTVDILPEKMVQWLVVYNIEPLKGESDQELEWSKGTAQKPPKGGG